MSHSARALRRLALLIALVLLAPVAATLPASAQPTSDPTGSSAPAAPAAPGAGGDRAAATVAPEVEDAVAEGPAKVIAVTSAPGDQVVDEVLAAVPDDAVVEAQQPTSAPQLALTVDAEGLDALREAPHVERVVENRKNYVAVDSWLSTIGQPATLAAGWDGAGQTIAILDTGVQSDHPFLTGKVVGEACFSSDSGDEEESLCPGGDVTATGPGSGAPCTGVSTCAHGTHVAGIAAGGPVSSPRALNGVAPAASIVSVQVFTKGLVDDECPGGSAPCLYAYDSDIDAALDWLHEQVVGSDPVFDSLAAVNLSLGGPGAVGNCDLDPTKAYVDALRSVGVATVAATGNSGIRPYMSSPACISTVLSVGATTGAGAIASFSNLSSVTSLVAPGSTLYSSVPGSTYASLSGTSMATPVVSGAVALLRQKAPADTVAVRLARLRATGDLVPTTVGVSIPEIQLDEALGEPPGAVGSVTATPGPASATVSWTVPASDGGSPLTGYTVTSNPTSAGCTTTATSCVVSGLTPGVPYTFTVVARNAVGPGPGASSEAVVPSWAPTLPLGPPIGSLDAVAAGIGSVSVSGWAIDPDQQGPIQVHVYVGGTGHARVADRSRPDVGAAFPGYGPNHGFSTTVPAGGGTHTVCAYAINVAVGGNSLLGCRAVTVPTGPPFGSLDAVAAGIGSVSVSGWAIDPDQEGPIQVHVYVDGTGHALVADRSRPDVGAVFPPYGPNHGYTGTLATTGGPHTVCAYAINVGAGATRQLGCRVVTVPTGPPFGSLDAVTRSGGTVSVAGWAIDPDVKGPIQVHVYVGGQGFPLNASQSRPDVGAVFPAYGAKHGFSATLPVSGVGVPVCAYAINVGGGSTTFLGCR